MNNQNETATNRANVVIGNFPGAGKPVQHALLDQMDEVRAMTKRISDILFQDYEQRVAAEAELVSLKEWKAKKEQQEQEERARAAMEAAHAPEESISVKELAEQLQRMGIETGQNRLFAWLRESGYVTRTESGHNRPSDKSRELGFLEEMEQPYQRSGGGEALGYTVRVTPKGQEYFMNLFAWYKEEIHARKAAKKELQRLQKNEKQREYDRAKRGQKDA